MKLYLFIVFCNSNPNIDRTHENSHACTCTRIMSPRVSVYLYARDTHRVVHTHTHSCAPCTSGSLHDAQHGWIRYVTDTRLYLDSVVQGLVTPITPPGGGLVAPRAGS